MIKEILDRKTGRIHNILLRTHEEIISEYYNTQKMKPVKITAEITLTPEMFHNWCDGDLPENEIIYHRFVEKMLYSKFGSWKDIGGYDEFINKKIDDNGNGLQLTIEEVE
jgi:hypothetical protein